MADDAPIPDEVHRQLGRELFNATWDLIDKVDRSAADDDAMLLSAAASRWHWELVGTAEQLATGDWQLAHVACLVGDGELARRFAQRNLDIAEREQWDGWRLASAHEGMARAYAVRGDRDACNRHIDAARAALEHEASAEERAVIEEQLATIPGV